MKIHVICDWGKHHQNTIPIQQKTLGSPSEGAKMGPDLYIKLFTVLIFFISTCQQIPDLILKPVKSIFLPVVKVQQHISEGSISPTAIFC